MIRKTTNEMGISYGIVEEKGLLICSECNRILDTYLPDKRRGNWVSRFFDHLRIKHDVTRKAGWGDYTNYIEQK